MKFHSWLHRLQTSSPDGREKRAAPLQNNARLRILPAMQASYFRYFTLHMRGALELVCGALKPGALEPWGAQTAFRKTSLEI